MKRATVCLLVLSGLVGLRAQTSRSFRSWFEQIYPPDRTYAVVVREDLPTVAVNGPRGNQRGKAELTVEIGDDGWKQAGSIGRESPTGALRRGEIVKVEPTKYSDNRVDLRLTSIEPHEIVRDPDRPERNRSEPVVTVMRVPRESGVVELLQQLDPYVRLSGSLDAAREYAATLGEPQPDRRFTLAVMRRDGILVPFASYDNGRWFRRWPLPSAEREVPIAMDAIPRDWWGIEGPRAAWTLWTPDGQSRAVQAAAPLAFDAHCMMNVGLRTDYRSPLPVPPLEQHHYPKDGVATTGSLRVEPIEVVTADDATWKTVEPLLVNYIDREESKLMLLHRVPAWPLVEPGAMTAEGASAARASVRPKLEVLCLAPGRLAGTHDVYFEATKRYAPTDKSAANPCGKLTFVRGWAHRRPDGTGSLDRDFAGQLTDCTQWDVEFRKPIGLVRVEGNPVWIIEVSRWGGESYELVEVGEQVKTVLTVPGGWCRSLGN